LLEIFPPAKGPNSTIVANNSIMASSAMGHRHSWQVNSSSG
jgi:hypothetical protein